MKFYKAIPVVDLNAQGNLLIPGTVTNDIKIAELWWERYNSKKKNIKGAAKHIKRSAACIIAFDFDESLLLHHSEFQRSGVSEHNRKNCWTSGLKDKAQINSVVNKYTIYQEAPKQHIFN